MRHLVVHIARPRVHRLRRDAARRAAVATPGRAGAHLEETRRDVVLAHLHGVVHALPVRDAEQRLVLRVRAEAVVRRVQDVPPEPARLHGSSAVLELAVLELLGRPARGGKQRRVGPRERRLAHRVRDPGEPELREVLEVDHARARGVHAHVVVPVHHVPAMVVPVVVVPAQARVAQRVGVEARAARGARRRARRRDEPRLRVCSPGPETLHELVLLLELEQREVEHLAHAVARDVRRVRLAREHRADHALEARRARLHELGGALAERGVHEDLQETFDALGRGQVIRHQHAQQQHVPRRLHHAGLVHVERQAALPQRGPDVSPRARQGGDDVPRVVRADQQRRERSVGSVGRRPLIRGRLVRATPAHHIAQVKRGGDAPEVVHVVRVQGHRSRAARDLALTLIEDETMTNVGSLLEKMNHTFRAPFRALVTSWRRATSLPRAAPAPSPPRPPARTCRTAA